MQTIKNKVESIRSISGAQVDRNFGQGPEAVLIQLETRSGQKEDMTFVADFITDAKGTLRELRELVLPHLLPDDYAFFLEFYGGFLIEATNYNFLLLGNGPLAGEWYPFILGDDGLYENGFLKIGILPFTGKRISQRVSFFLDIAGVVHPHCIIGIPSWKLEGIRISVILQDLHGHSRIWTRHANSFTEWLGQVATTQGLLGYGEEEN